MAPPRNTSVFDYQKDAVTGQRSIVERPDRGVLKRKFWELEYGITNRQS